MICSQYSDEKSQLVANESIFAHYESSSIDENRADRWQRIHRSSSISKPNYFIERNQSNKKSVNAKTIKRNEKKSNSTSRDVTSKKGKQEKKSIQNPRRDQMPVIKITLPDSAKQRKTNFRQENKIKDDRKFNSAVKEKSIDESESDRSRRGQLLPKFDPEKEQTNLSMIQQLSVPSKTLETQSVPSHTRVKHQSSPLKNSSLHEKDISKAQKPMDTIKTHLDIQEIHQFIRNLFQNSFAVMNKPPFRPTRIRLKCAKITEEEKINEDVSRRSRFLNDFEEYINHLKRQFGVIRSAKSDLPIFEPGISIMGPSIKKDSAIVDKEDSDAIQKMSQIEPRKKYALVHEHIGIFIIGGYNLRIDIQTQEEPTTDYLFRFNGHVSKIASILPHRVHFGAFTDGEGIYVAGGQTLKNELLDDVQRLNLKTLRWEHIVNLPNPVAACGMTMDQQKIYIIGGYDIVQNQAIFLSDCSIYNLATGKFETTANLPSPRCRSLIFVTNDGVFCVSGLIEIRAMDGNRKLKICTDILRWTAESPRWIKISDTPELNRHNALSFNDPYLEIIKRKNDEDTATITEAYYNFSTNQWHAGPAPVPEHVDHSQSQAHKTLTQLPKTIIKHRTKSRHSTPSKQMPTVARGPKTPVPSKTKVKNPNQRKQTRRGRSKR